MIYQLLTEAVVFTAYCLSGTIRTTDTNTLEAYDSVSQNLTSIVASIP